MQFKINLRGVLVIENKIIVVDDDELSLYCTASMIELISNEILKNDIQVISFDNPVDAWSYIESNFEKCRILGVITDYDMPRMTGEELAIKISSLGIPVVIYSGNKFLDERDEYKYIYKPTSLEKLKQTIENDFLSKEYVTC